MDTWNSKELQEIIKEDDLHISPLRTDGETYGTPTWIWCVAVDDDLYVRAYNGQQSSWYQAAMKQGVGQVHAAGNVWDVHFESVNGEINDRIDKAYKEKYQDSSYLSPMIGQQARSATVRVKPRDITS